MMFGITTGKEMPAPEDKRTIEERLTDIEKALKELSRQLSAVAQVASHRSNIPISEATFLRAYGNSENEIKRIVGRLEI